MAVCWEVQDYDHGQYILRSYIVRLFIRKSESHGMVPGTPDDILKLDSPLH